MLLLIGLYDAYYLPLSASGSSGLLLVNDCFWSGLVVFNSCHLVFSLGAATFVLPSNSNVFTDFIVYTVLRQ